MNTTNFDHYLAKYSTYPLSRMITEYHFIEDELMEDVISSAFSMIQHMGAALVGDLLQIADDHYALKTDFISANRTLVLNFVPISSVAFKPFTSRKSINHIGAIREIRIVSPTSLEKIGEALAEHLAKQTSAAYEALKASFMGQAEEFHSGSLKLLHEMISAYLISYGHDELTSKFWLVVFDGDAGYYSLDRDALRRALNHYRENQDDTISPLEMTIWIATSPLPFADSLSSSSLEYEKPLQQSYSKAKFISSSQKFWRANKQLVDCDDYAVFPLAQTGSYSLTVAYSAEYKNEIEGALVRVGPDVKRQFQENLKTCSVWLNSVRAVGAVVRSQPVITHAKDIAAKVIAELIRTSSGPR